MGALYLRILMPNATLKERELEVNT